MSAPGTVLVIDDNEGITEAFARMLRLEGFQVRTALSAEKGLQEAETAPPDAIILDLRMPSIDGLGFLYRLRMRETCRDIPVAMVTGDYTVDDLVAREIAGLGAQLHFKPLWMDDLLGLAHALVGGRATSEAFETDLDHVHFGTVHHRQMHLDCQRASSDAPFDDANPAGHNSASSQKTVATIALSPPETAHACDEPYRSGTR